MVVFTDSHISELIEFNHEWRTRGKMVVCDVRGLCGALFIDFGVRFKYVESMGFPHLDLSISTIECNGNRLVITVADEIEYPVHFVQSGCLVRLAGIQGMTQLNDRSFQVIHCEGRTLEMEINEGIYAKYEGGGLVTCDYEEKTVNHVCIKFL